MGFLNNNGEAKLIAKLTPIGKNNIIANGVKNLVTKFVLGDSDANYHTELALKDGLIADTSYNSDGLYYNYQIKYKINYSDNSIYKTIGTDNTDIVEENDYHAFEYEGTNDEIVFIDRAITSPNLNLLTTIGAPITDSEMNEYSYGKYSNNALKNLNKDKYLVLPVDVYDGTLVDGQSLKVTIFLGEKEITLYSSFSEATSTPDDILFDTNNLISGLNMNSVMLFSDDIARPINDNSKSWGDNFGDKSPYSKGKLPFNLFTPNGGSFGDKIVGYFLLDKGLIVIVDEYIISNRESIEYYSIDGTMNYVNQKYEITCLINRNDFNRSNNPTYKNGLPIRVSEIGLYDDYQRLVGVAKFNEHLILDRTKPVIVSIIINF